MGVGILPVWLAHRRGYGSLAASLVAVVFCALGTLLTGQWPNNGTLPFLTQEYQYGQLCVVGAAFAWYGRRIAPDSERAKCWARVLVVASGISVARLFYWWVNVVS